MMQRWCRVGTLIEDMADAGRPGQQQDEATTRRSNSVMRRPFVARVFVCVSVWINCAVLCLHVLLVCAIVLHLEACFAISWKWMGRLFKGQLSIWG